MGVKASLTLGREEMHWVKGLFGFNNVVEKFSLVWRWFLYDSWSMGSMEAICLLHFGRYKEMCVRGGFIDSLEKAC